MFGAVLLGLALVAGCGNPSPPVIAVWDVSGDPSLACPISPNEPPDDLESCGASTGGGLSCVVCSTHSACDYVGPDGARIYCVDHARGCGDAHCN